MTLRVPSNEKLIVTIFFLLALSLRLLGLSNIRLRGDFAYHWAIAGKIVKEGSYPLLGPSASINPTIHLGPFYYYLLSIPYFIGNGNYKIAIIFFSLLNSLSIFPLFYVSKKWFSKKASFQIITLYSISSYLIQIQNFPWNPYIIPTIIIFSFFCLLKVKEKPGFYLPILFLLLGLGIQSHATFLFLIPLFLIYIPFRKISGKVILASLLIFFLPNLPWFYYEVNNHYLQIKEIFNVFSPSSEICNFSIWLKVHGHGERCFHQIRNTLFIFRLISQSLFSTRNLPFVIISFFMTLYTLVKAKNSQKIFFIIWIMSIFIFFMFYSQNIYLHFFLILVPLPIFIFVLFLERIRKMKRPGGIIAQTIFIAIVSWNLIDYLYSLLSTRG